jgi:hypothetical protein
MSGEGLERTVVLPEIPAWDEDKLLAQLTRYFQQLNYHTAFAYDEVGKHVNELPVMLTLAFYQDNVAATQTDVELLQGGSNRGFIMPEDGSVVAIGVRTNDARTAGTLTVDPTVNGTKTGLTAVLNATDTTYKTNRQDPGLDTFVAGDRISCVITTDGSWAPTTADIDVVVGVVLQGGIE